MNPLLDIDNWLLRQYQKVADWCYSEWDVSPYAVAAQLFAVATIFGVALYCLGINLILFMTILLSNSAMFWFAVQRDAVWKKKRMPMPLTVIDVVLRIFFVVAVCMQTAVFIYLLLTRHLPFAELIDFAQNLVTTSAFYFYACCPPTFIERRDHKLVPQT